MSRLPRDARLYSSDPRDRQQIPEPYNLFQFYSASDGPWIPNGVIQPTATLNLSSHPPTYNTGARSFQGYRSTGVPSECGTAAEDSGYGGTRSTYSFVESAASIAENDRGTETGYLEPPPAEQLLSHLNLNSAITIYQPTVPYSGNPHVDYRCDQCEAVVKTKSELKKHRHRHNRPYKCNYESCPKGTQGFSTANDLARHKRTVHREIDHNVPVYICRHDPCTRKKEKPWPRADNFRSHLARSHNIHLKADHDLREYRQQYASLSAAKPQEPRHDRNAVPKVNSGRRSTQLQVAPSVYPRPDVASIRPEATEAPELRGVGSSVEDVDPGPRPAQLQDSPDLRGDQSPAHTFDQVHNEIPDQSSSSCPPGGEKPDSTQSIAFEDLELSPTSGSGPLASDQTVEVAPMDQDSSGAPKPALPRNEARPEALDQDEIDCSGEEEEPHNHQESSLPRIESSDVSLQPKPSASENGIFEAQQTIVASDDAPGSSDDAPADTVTFNLRNPSELFTFLKQVPMDVALKNGASDVLSFLRNIPKDLLEKALNPEDQGATASTLAGDEGASHKGTATCTEPGCGKVFYRQCELRKHMKRHKKPYGCTYRKCNKHFGSKNDWKRHESSQHFQLESWHCDVTGCNKVLPRRELFRSHLLNHHRLTDDQEVEKKLESCRLGRHCDPRFWCGFCDQFIEVKGEVVNSWTKRCDHIDNHLFGKEGMPKKTMNEWRYLEDKLAEEESESAIVERLPELSKKRKATEALDARPSKKTLYRWRCCHCSHMETLSISTSCQESDCQHQRCDNCQMEITPVPDEDSEMVDREYDEVDEE